MHIPEWCGSNELFNLVSGVACKNSCGHLWSSGSPSSGYWMNSFITCCWVMFTFSSSELRSIYLRVIFPKVLDQINTRAMIFGPVRGYYKCWAKSNWTNLVWCKSKVHSWKLSLLKLLKLSRLHAIVTFYSLIV